MKIISFSLKAIIFLVAGIFLCNGVSFAKATPRYLTETPRDRTVSTEPEYQGYKHNGLLSYVYDGAAVNGTNSCCATIAAGANSPELVLALGDGGIASFSFKGAKGYCSSEVTGNVTGILDREDVYDTGSNRRALIVTRVVADDMDAEPDQHQDEVFFISGAYIYAYSLDPSTGALSYDDSVLVCDPGDCTAESQTTVWMPTDLTIYKGANSTTDRSYIVVSAKDQASSKGKLFAIFFDESDGTFDKTGSDPDWDTMDLGSVLPNAVASATANVTASGDKYYVFVAGGTTLGVYTADDTKSGNCSSSSTTSCTDCMESVVSASFEGTPYDVAVYCNSDVDQTNGTHTDAAGDECLVFVATSSGIYGYELDYWDNAYHLTFYPTTTSSATSLVASELGEVEFKGLYAVNTTTTFDDSWLLAAGGSNGIYVFSVSAGNDTLSLSYAGSIDTTGTSEKVFYGAGNSTALHNIYLADGAAGFKEVNGTGMDSTATRELRLKYQWDESVAPQAIQIVGTFSTTSYGAVVLDQAGGIRLYEIGTGDSDVPQVLEENGTGTSREGKLGFDLAWSSNSSEFGYGSNLAGTPHDMDVYFTSNTANIFIAAGEAGIKKMTISNSSNDTSRSYARTGSNLISYDTPGDARGISVYPGKTGSMVNSKYYVAVADGGSGVLLMHLGTSDSEFTRDTQVSLSGGAVAEDVLIDYRTTDAYVYVAYGDRGLLVLDVQSSTSSKFNDWSNPSQAAIISKTSLGGYAKKLAIARPNAYGSSTYYLFVLVQQASGAAITIVDVSTPSSPTVKATYTGLPTATDMDFFWDQGNQDKRYLMVSTSGSNATLAVLNVSNVEVPVKGGDIDITAHAISVASQYVGSTTSFVLIGESQVLGTSAANRGYLGRALLSLTGAQTVSVSLSADPQVVTLGGSATLSAAVTGGESPYTYSWSASARSGDENGTFSSTSNSTVVWTAPSTTADTFTITVSVTDSDGNTGTATTLVKSKATGVAVINRIGKTGSSVTVPIEVSGVNDRVIDAWGMDVTFDSTKLTYVGMETPTDLAGWQVTGELVSDGTVRIAGHAGSVNDFIPAGSTTTLVTLKFSIAEGLNPGDVIAITPKNAVDDIQGVSLTAGQFTVVCPGDVDGSGLLSPQDALWIFYYTLDLYNLSDDEAQVADVDGDGFVTITDATSVMQSFVSNGGTCQ